MNKRRAQGHYARAVYNSTHERACRLPRTHSSAVSTPCSWPSWSSPASASTRWPRPPCCPLRQADVARHALLGRLLSPDAMASAGPAATGRPPGLAAHRRGASAACWPICSSTSFVRGETARHRAKLALIWLIIVLTVFLPSLKLVLLRQASGPASYSHDGGVIQTEATIDYLLDGRNPYVEDYVNTPMAEWGINEFRTALYHYPYLPWTFLFSAPFKLASEALARLVRSALRLSAAVRADPAPAAEAGRHAHAQAAARHAGRAEPAHGLRSDLRPERQLRPGVDCAQPVAVAAGTRRQVAIWPRLWRIASGGRLRPRLRQQTDRLVLRAVLPAVDRRQRARRACRPMAP